jgi:lactoylglutathione lyase
MWVAVGRRVRLIHTALDVSDVEATLDFYESLGLSYAHEFTLDGVRNVYVSGDGGMELQFRDDPDEAAPADPSGVDHVAVEVDDVDAEFGRVVEETDCPVVHEPMDVPEAGARAAFVEDPDGYAVELVAYLD